MFNNGVHPARRARNAAGIIGATTYVGMVWVIGAQSEKPMTVDLSAVVGLDGSAGAQTTADTGVALDLAGGATAVSEDDLLALGPISSDGAGADAATTASSVAPAEETTTVAPSTAAPSATDPATTAPATTAPATTAPATTAPATTAPTSAQHGDDRRQLVHGSDDGRSGRDHHDHGRPDHHHDPASNDDHQRRHLMPADRPPTVERRFRAMSTDVHVVVVGGSTGLLDRAEAAVVDRDRRWSRFRPDSEISAINANQGRPVIVADDTFALVAAAVDAHRQTGGVFDPTVWSSLMAAGYDRSLDQVVADPGPSRHVPAPGPDGIELHPAPRAVLVPPGVGLDLGGIAKGVAADAVAADLLAAGAAGCCVNIGGDARFAGTAPTGGWLVGLRCPGADQERVVTLAEGAVCTSTTLRRRWTATEHHLRDPASGRPLERGLWSVSIIGRRAAQAEVLTKVALAAGHRAPDVLAGHGVTGVLVDDRGEVVELQGLAPFLVDRVPLADPVALAGPRTVGEAASAC